MTHKSQFAKTLSSLIAIALFVSGCTKTRDASLPEEAQESILAISEFGNVQTENSALKVSTDDTLTTLSLGESAKATNEKGSVTVIDAQVPERLRYMFRGLEMTGQAGHSYPITLSVDKQFVTAYKIVSDISELTILEKQLAQAKDEVLLQKQIQKTKDAKKVKALIASLRQARSAKVELLNKKSGTVLVPLFKYKVEAFGTLERTTNELKEKTSTLRLKASDWVDATHIKIPTTSSARLPVGIDPATSGDLDRTFVMDRINNKIMTAGTLKNEYQIPVNASDDTRVLTLLDVDALHVFEIGQLGKTELSDSQLAQLHAGSNKSNVRQCPTDLVAALPKEVQKGCILILRYDVKVAYVRPELPLVDHEGNQDAKITFQPVSAGQNVGLVQIAKNVEVKKVENNNEMDPRSTLRVADIKNKEFFFKRTLEDAPVTTIFPPGMAGSLTIIKFEMQETRLVIRKMDKLVDFKSGSNDTDYEELMSFPVKYLKRDLKDASGAEYSISRVVPASRADAELIEVDWTKNTLSSHYSPYGSLQDGCFDSVASSDVSDVDMKMDKGVLNFSINYSVGLRGACLTDYAVSNDYNGTASYQTTARLKERVSFKLNDGTTDKAFAPQVPFRAQNEMSYGVWTIGQINPTKQGLTGREGQEQNFSVVHDFRNGKKLLYTVTGVEPSVDLDPEIRALYRETITDVVNSWDFAYKQAFKGTALERSGRYIEIQFSGDEGVNAHVGDLDANIIHFENKFNDNHGILGVSQVGYNPRSGIVVADSLIIYAGNLQKFVASYQRSLNNAHQWADMKEGFRKQALADLDKKQKADADAQKLALEAAKPEASVEKKAEAAAQFSNHLLKMSQGHKVDPSVLLKVKNLNLTAGDVKTAAKQMKALGTGKFQYSAPQMESAWIDRVMRKLTENPSMDAVELQGLISKEMLTSYSGKLSATQRGQLEKSVQLGSIRARLSAQFKNSTGCMMTARESVSRNFAAMTFKQALREELFFDAGHEMGHSQGLTHNFIGSFDKANFKNEDGSESKRNYSSIMDYIEPGKFAWDGIGAYDVHALRASHLGLLEVTPELKASLEKQGTAKNILQNDKFIHVDTIKANFAKSGWNNFSKHSMRGLLKPYKYCTDIHVGYEPTCQRFDYGTSAAEIVENMVQDYEENYVNNYHGWDRNNFGYAAFSGAVGRTINNMFQMRQFMDELFYKLVLNDPDEASKQDYMQASLKAYLFYTQVIKTPDASSGFLTQDRFTAVPYQYEEINEKGQKTGKTVSDIQIVEKRSTMNMLSTDERFDTIGIEYDKIMAMNFLTMKGFPAGKYYSNSIIFSFLDFEKYILGMQPENSLFVNTLTGMMLNQLQASFSNEHAQLSPLQGEKAEVTASMRAYAGIYGILNLEATTLRDKDNFANFFKVGSSVGAAKTDRISLSNLGVSEKSESRVSFWAIDSAVAANTIVAEAAHKNFFLQNEDALKPVIVKAIVAQFQDLLSGGKQEAEVKKAQDELLAKLTELNKDGHVVSAATLKANPGLAVENQVANLMAIHKQVISVAIAAVTQQANAQQAMTNLKGQLDNLAEFLPLFAIDQKIMKETLTLIGQNMSKQKGAEMFAQLGQAAGMMMDGSQLDVSYGIIIKNLEFLNKLTNMTNPEYAR